MFSFYYTHFIPLALFLPSKGWKMEARHKMTKRHILYAVILTLFIWTTVSLSMAAEETGEFPTAVSKADLTDSSSPATFKISTKEFHLKNVESDDSAINLSLTPDIARARTESQVSPQMIVRNRKSSNKSFFTVSVVTLAALNIADYLSTREALKYPCLCEGNPLMKGIAKNELLLAGVKLGVAACNYVLLKKLYKRNKTLALIISTAANVALSYVVANNMNMIQKARRM